MSKLTDEQINQMWSDAHNDTSTMSLIHVLARAIEAAATEPLLQRIAEFVTALDEEMVVSHLGVFNPWDDPKKAIKNLMLWSQGVGEYFAGEKAKERIAELEKALKLVQQHHATAWNRGHIAGMAANRMVAQDALNAVKKDAWNNTQLTEALMAAEGRCEELEQRNRDLYEDVQRFKKHALNEKAARLELEANEKVLLAQVQGHTKWREKIVKASEQAYGESVIRYKFSLTKTGKCMNTFPKEIDGRWFALVPAEDDGHIGHIARIAELERQLEEARKDAERLDYIQKNARNDPKMDGNHVWWPTTFNQAQSLKGPTIRAAIDAAMQKGQS